ncbi:MAG: bifunctional phosphopantothenoylcysteine decarboxylase/phosphopantothenate--cysteine ligase CoaBC [Chloroflexi bacterium CFX4]|nr:bifunctional phosphopantothenoylcysteine decarboxylase/phosphopantothenate--cysteine ligase CoaBC [Chloroflexi bacterium CFX4]MDL1922046.1 bifunctional phosphopantothenoylcysteine decarboxylase/phosphopantothenate--cysteine ligase CoaBC [Chloroflexi bacterium CFX3]
MSILEYKRIVLGITGSIAAYKAADLASKLTQAGADVDVIMTEAATRFVAPLTFEAVTGRTVYTDMWQTAHSESLPTHVAHVGLAEGADLILIAPATAQHLAKLAHGFADDLLCITVLSAKCPIVIVPAMDAGMYENAAVAANVARLRELGIEVIEPEIGRMASGMVGRGRLPEVWALLGAARQVLGREWGALRDRHVVVTAGGTREALDPVRFITNRSSGRQGYAIAQAAVDSGAHVTLIAAPNELPTPYGVELVPVESAQEMLDAVLEYAEDADALIMAAAVADYRPEETADHKIKKAGKALQLSLVPTVDVLATVGARRAETGRPHVLVGFAAETRDLLKNARSKLEKKHVDYIVANDVSLAGAGFGTDTNIVTILSADGSAIALPQQTKSAVAEAIVQRVAARLQTVPRRTEPDSDEV